MRVFRMSGSTIGGAVAVLLMLTACSSGSASPPASTAEATASAAAQVQRTPMTKDRAKEFFLATVCPVTTSLKIVDNLWIDAGGWKAVVPSKARPYTQSASDEARKAATALTDGGVAWPDGLLPSIDAMKVNFLGMIVPLEAMVNAPTGAAMEAPWSKVALNPRVAEQQARIDLGLPAANAAKDGCPPVPRSKSKPVALPKPGGNGSSGGGGGPNNWQSPSGNLRCGYFEQGSDGPSVACLDAETNTLVILNVGATRTVQASQSQRDQLRGGAVQDFGDAARYWGGLFKCELTSEGMTCQDNTVGSWFVIRKGWHATSG